MTQCAPAVGDFAKASCGLEIAHLDLDPSFWPPDRRQKAGASTSPQALDLLVADLPAGFAQQSGDPLPYPLDVPYWEFESATLGVFLNGPELDPANPLDFPSLSQDRLVFADETWIKTNMTPLRGWAQKGRRLKGYAPHVHWRTMTFLAALSANGISAPCGLDGPFNTRCFQAWVEQELVPTLRPGDIVILDNLTRHRSKAVRQAIRSTGARLWSLPPYSPDLNPIEQPFAKIKHWMHNAQRRDFEDTSSPPSSQANAKTTSETSDTVPSKADTL